MKTKVQLKLKKQAKSVPDDLAKYSLKSMKERPRVAEATPRQIEKQPRETIEREMTTTSFETVNSFDSYASCEDTETNDVN